MRGSEGHLKIEGRYGKFISMKKDRYGMIVALAIAVVSLVLSNLHSSFDPLVVSMILGMLVANFFDEKEFLKGGVDQSLKYFLPVGIALYGAQLSVKMVNVYFFPGVLAVFLSLFFLVYIVSRILGIENRTGILLATGFSVCGASAIAIVSPLIRAKNEETSISLIVVMLFGLTGVVFYPVLMNILDLSLEEFAFFTGTTLPMLGQVKITAASFGQECLDLAVKFKLLRISMLFFIVTIAIVLNRESAKKWYVPWYIIVFIVLAVFVNIYDLSSITVMIRPVSSFALSVALASIGLSVDFNSITELGPRPLFAIGISWVIIFLLIYMVMGILNV